MSNQPSNEKSTLDSLIEGAEENAAEHKLERFYEERLKEFKVSEVYLAHADLLIELVEPLRALLPTQEQYHAYANRGPAGNSRSLEGMRRLKNPAIVTVHEARLSEKEDDHSWRNMTDESWNGLINSVDFIKDFWEENESADTLSLAKAIILHTVFYNEELCETVLREASEMVRIMQIPASDLKAWKDH